jgi:glycosyltransferase involved in cell wall biosynthesis
LPTTVAKSYLLVLPVPCRELAGGRFAVESAFAAHLKQQLESFGGHVDELVLAAPWIDAADYEQVRSGWATLDPAVDRIRFVPMHPAAQGRLAYLLRLPGLVARLLRLAGASTVVHAGPSAAIWHPFEILGVLAGLLRRKRTVYVIDIDYRQSARMLRSTGAMSFGAYLRKHYLHHGWMGLQTRLAARFVDVVMLKGRSLVADFGRGRPNVHYILDAAHHSGQVLDEAATAARAAALAARPRGSLRLVYFGRLVAYKGVDCMLEAVAAAVAAGVDATLAIYGLGPDESRLRELAAQLSLGERVQFLGARPYGDAFLAEVGEFDALLACPLSEDTPRSAVDAQARALPVVAFDSYYYRELREQGAGVITSPWRDVAALGATLVALANDRSRLAAAARAGREFAVANTQDLWLARRAEWTFGPMSG